MNSDAELVQQAHLGNREAYSTLIDRYERLARATALGVVRDCHLAEDVVQEAFIAAFQSLERLRDPSRYGAWLLGIVRRRAARVLRMQCREPALMRAKDTAAVQQNGRPSVQLMELLELVGRLPEHERIVVGLRHFDGHSVEEVARITGRPVGTVTKQLSRAHGRLRRWLGEE